MNCNNCRKLKGEIAMLKKEIEILKAKVPGLQEKVHSQRKIVIPDWAKSRGSISNRRR